jgi:hypothetical protein
MKHNTGLRLIRYTVYLTLYFFYHGVTAPSGSRPPHYREFTVTDTSQSVGLLWTSDQPDPQTSTWQHTTLTRDKHPCHRRDSNPQTLLHRAFQFATCNGPTNALVCNKTLI